MTKITLKGNEIETIGQLPANGQQAIDFSLIRNDLSEVRLENYAGKRKILNIFPSLDTPVCATSVRHFNEKAAQLENTIVLCISRDLPFAQKRFCGAEGIENVETLSAHNSDFGKNYGVLITTGPLTGLFSRAIVALDEKNNVVYTEQVPEIAQEPNYEKALSAIS